MTTHTAQGTSSGTQAGMDCLAAAPRFLCLLMLALVLNGCSAFRSTLPPAIGDPHLTPRTGTFADLTSLPRPRGPIIVSVYGFRDQTGQYKSSPASSFSTSVTQGATAMLVEALGNSGWFVPLEREGLQNLLTERKIIRAAQEKATGKAVTDADFPSLMAADILLEGGIVAYDTNVATGGLGARYFGIGGAEQYRVDQVTVNLRAVDIRSGQVLHSVLVSKTILSKEITTGIYTFIDQKRLLEYESGMTQNEPAQLCVLAAIESAVIHLVSDGVRKRLWALADPKEQSHELLARYSSTARQPSAVNSEFPQ